MTKDFERLGQIRRPPSADRLACYSVDYDGQLLVAWYGKSRSEDPRSVIVASYAPFAGESWQVSLRTDARNITAVQMMGKHILLACDGDVAGPLARTGKLSLFDLDGRMRESVAIGGRAATAFATPSANLWISFHDDAVIAQEKFTDLEPGVVFQMSPNLTQDWVMPKGSGLIDCYLLNSSAESAWFLGYEGFDLFCADDDKLRKWSNLVTDPLAMAVWPGFVAFVRGGEPRLTLCKLGEGELVEVMQYPLTSHHWLEARQMISRESEIHQLRDGEWLRFVVSESIAFDA